jgi:hypothetical protein
MALSAKDTTQDPIEDEEKESNPESPADSSPQGIERLRLLYEQRVVELQRDSNPKFDDAVRIAELVEEPNILSFYRLIEIFGSEVVAEKAAQAWLLFQEAKTKGPEAYVKSENGTPVATKKGQPRTPGGVFFYLMRQHSDGLGLHWTGLHLPKLPGSIAHLRPKLKFNVATQTEETPAEKPSGTVPPKKAAAAAPTNAQPKAANPGKPKPARANLKVVGPLVGKPKHQPNGQVGIVELVIKSEMNTALPKGLPNLGSTKIVVWCTEKQFNKIKNTITAESRFVIEGEPYATVGADLKAFLRVVCLKLTTIEIEQALRNVQEQQGIKPSKGITNG